MFQRILVPLDGSHLAETALPHAVAMAQAGGGEVFLLRALDLIGAVTRPRSVDPFDWQIRKTEVEMYLKEVAQQLEEQGVSARHAIVEGKAADEIIEFAHQNQIDLIALSSHGQSGVTGWNVSSVVQKVILRAQTSILLVRAYAAQRDLEGEQGSSYRYRHILLPLDGSQRAECVLPLAETLSRVHQSELIVVHVVKKPEIPRRTPPTQEDLDLVERITARNRTEAEKYLTDLRTRVDAQMQVQILISDNAASELHRMVEQNPVDLVILSAHGYSGETRWPYGSVVTGFITYGRSPLLVFQDLSPNQIQPSPAETAAREKGGR